jgi:asparagine synthase (glutamine-hydrolysing)
MRRYWWWDEDVKPLSGKIDKDQLAEEMGRRFIDGVRRRTRERGRVGIELSGGLDSRAAFAAMPEGDYPIHAVTLGKKDCEEVRIAAAVTRVKRNAIHHVFELTGDNWFVPRIAGVWQTDGSLVLRHMHDFFLQGMVKEFYDAYLHGAGGGIVGGASQFEPTQEAFLASLREKYYQAPELLTPEFVQANEQDLVDYFNSLGSSHALYADRIVRLAWIHCVKANRDAGVEGRFPIFDNSFQELLFSIPLEQRLERGVDRDDTLYKKMLLRAFPAYYRTIPYHNIGIPISWPDPANLVSGAVCLVRRAKNKVLKEAMGLVGATFSYPNWYTDYENWIRREPARSFFDKLLTSPSALYGEYIPPQRVRELWRRHLTGEDHAEVLCRYLTLELWLQQVYEGQYRRLGSEEADDRFMEINHSMEASLA